MVKPLTESERLQNNLKIDKSLMTLASYISISFAMLGFANLLNLLQNTDSNAFSHIVNTSIEYANLASYSLIPAVIANLASKR